METTKTFTVRQVEAILTDFAEWMNCNEVTYGKYANHFNMDGEFVSQTSTLIEKYLEGRDWSE